MSLGIILKLISFTLPVKKTIENCTTDYKRQVNYKITMYFGFSDVFSDHLMVAFETSPVRQINRLNQFNVTDFGGVFKPTSVK